MPVRVRIFDDLGVSDGQVLKSDRTVIRGGSAFDRQDSGDFRLILTPTG